jgi:hypothetical protein
MVSRVCDRKSVECTMESAKCSRDGRFRAEMAGDARGMASLKRRNDSWNELTREQRGCARRSQTSRNG